MKWPFFFSFWPFFCVRQDAIELVFMDDNQKSSVTQGNRNPKTSHTNNPTFVLRFSSGCLGFWLNRGLYVPHVQFDSCLASSASKLFSLRRQPCWHDVFVSKKFSFLLALFHSFCHRSSPLRRMQQCADINISSSLASKGHLVGFFLYNFFYLFIYFFFGQCVKNSCCCSNLKKVSAVTVSCAL